MQQIEIYIVGLNVNVDANCLRHLLEIQTERRNRRGQEISYKLAKIGIPAAWEQAKAYAAGGK